jgi:hypothetical protein
VTGSERLQTDRATAGLGLVDAPRVPRALVRVRRAAWPMLLLLAAAFVVAVQRDTFVRRWLVPAETPGRANLRKVIPEVQIAGATFEQAATEIGRLAGVTVVVDHSARAALGRDEQRFEVRLTNVTLDDALAALLAQDDARKNNPLIVDTRGAQVVVRWVGRDREYRAAGTAVVRAYDVGDLVPAATPALASGDPTPREWAVDDLRLLAAYRIPEPYDKSGASVYRLGWLVEGHIILIVAPEVDQRGWAADLRAIRAAGGRLDLGPWWDPRR